MPHPARPPRLRPARIAPRRAPLLAGLAVSVALAACAGTAEQERQVEQQAAGSAPTTEAQLAPSAHTAHALPESTLVATVYKTPTCGCCKAWVDHLTASGFRVTTVDREDLTSVKAEHGVGDHLASCHTALIGGYVVEGHVPAADIKRLLAERPAVAGIAVPGMPVGSPGMEMPGAPADRYDVVSFDRAGATRVFASH